jgi:hypothetical protein
MNLDVFAYGNEFFVTASKRDGALVRALRTAASADNMPVRDAPVDRYPGSDHRSMISAGLETVGVARRYRRHRRRACDRRRGAQGR